MILERGIIWEMVGSLFFLSVDPISDKFPHISTYNYADNSPSNIDLHGLQALFAADGRLIGYKVQAGQGPTQITQDLNENHSNKINGKIVYTNVVYGNLNQFKNVVEGKGEVFDINNKDFELGNIAPGDLINISDGFDGLREEAIELTNQISNLNSQKEELNSEVQILEKERELINKTSQEFPGDPKIGNAVAKTKRLLDRELKINDLNSQKKPIQTEINNASAKLNEINKVLPEKLNN